VPTRRPSRHDESEAGEEVFEALEAQRLDERTI